MERTGRRTRAVVKETAVTTSVVEICQINRTQQFVSQNKTEKKNIIWLDCLELQEKLQMTFHHFV
jgi:hypothetical protein